MTKPTLTLEHALYALALAIALTLRFLHLGALPLSDYEADWAMQAFRLAAGLRPDLGPDPAYVHLTAILFYILGATNFLARFWPALAGSALVLGPWFLRGRLGRLPALILAFGLAIDPGLAGLSRLAGGPMLALAFVVFAGLMWLNSRRALAGLFGGLALLSGPSVWFGLSGLGLAWVAASFFEPKAPAQPVKKTRRQAADLPRPKTSGPGPERPAWEQLKVALLWAAGTVLTVGSLFVLSPQGLPAFVKSLLAFLRGWVTLSGVPLWQPLLALPAYELFPLGFAIAGVVRGILRKDADARRLGLWALVALVLALVYPGKQTGDLAWALLPLWVLAAFELSHHFDFAGHRPWQLAGMITLVFSLLIFAWLELASLTTIDPTMEAARVRWLLLVAIALLIGLGLLVSGVGWSTAVARLGGIWGMVPALVLFTLAMATGATGLREPRTLDLWQPEPRTAHPQLLPKVAGQISELNVGYDAQLPLTITGVDSPALLWLFRDWQVQEAAGLAADAAPQLIITPMGELSLTAKYRGETLTLSELAVWEAATRGDWLEWLVYRQIPLSSEDVILWVRSDLTLDSQGVPETAP